MKKLLSVIVAATLLLCLTASVALAADPTGFRISVQCVTTGTYDLTYTQDWSDFKTLDNKKIHVNHSVEGGGGNAYNNYFHAIRSDTNNLTQDKWVKPAGKYPIEGVGLKTGYRYRLAARGNTYHYENHGATRVVLNGNFWVNN